MLRVFLMLAFFGIPVLATGVALAQDKSGGDAAAEPAKKARVTISDEDRERMRAECRSKAMSDAVTTTRMKMYMDQCVTESIAKARQGGTNK